VEGDPVAALPAGGQVRLGGTYSLGVNGESGIDLNLHHTPAFTLPNGVTRDFRARISGIDGRGSEELDRSEGKVRSEGNKGGDARSIGEAAGAGASIGTIAGGASNGHYGMGAGIGAAAGAAAGLVGVLLSPVIWTYVLHDYQRDRVTTFLDPSKDPKGKGLQQIQAKVTVGSGGLFGKGFRQGTQGGYGFLPVAHNDFVYSVLAEEHGFLGVLVTLALYLFVLMRSLDAAKLAKDRVGTFLVVAIISGFAFQVVYNITMSAGLAPVKGLTLPLMSYGGSSLVATFAAFGLILNVRMRRFTN